MPDETLLLTKDDLVAEHFADPNVRARWDRAALARAVAHAVLGYRIANKLSQRALAARLGMKQPHIARLELGEHNPSIETLARLANILGTRFIIDVAPADQAVAAALKLPLGVRIIEDVTSPAGSRVLVAAG